MSNKDYDKKTETKEEIDHKIRKVEWKIKDKELTRTVLFDDHNAKIRRIFNFASKTVVRFSINTKDNSVNEGSIQSFTFKEVKKVTPDIMEKAGKQYGLFKKM